MKQLVNFIPKSVAECRALLVKIRDGNAETEYTDRDGNVCTLSAAEAVELTRLVESQIGEKTPVRPAPAKERKNAKKEENEDGQER